MRGGVPRDSATACLRLACLHRPNIVDRGVVRETAKCHIAELRRFRRQILCFSAKLVPPDPKPVRIERQLAATVDIVRLSNVPVLDLWRNTSDQVAAIHETITL